MKTHGWKPDLDRIFQKLKGGLRFAQPAFQFLVNLRQDAVV